MKEIQLTRGYVTVVDDEDYEWLSQWKWHASSGTNGSVYAVRKCSVTEKRGHRFIALHREITNAPCDLQVDHIDGNSLNNRRSNLRLCTQLQNNQNAPKNKRNTSGYKGVHWNIGEKKWVAHIRVNQKKVRLGSFGNVEDAAKAYAEASRKYHGEFGRIE